ncbi:MAG: sel1 repeat family protein [Verrucomicrobia bacterium]|nr:sel1 repeat family protein [Verrucomicrobiota bacterium]
MRRAVELLYLIAIFPSFFVCGEDVNQASQPLQSTSQDLSDKNLSNRERAEGGDLAAQREVMVKFYNSRNIPDDLSPKEFDWLLKKADFGNMLCQYNVGFCYETGRGVSCDINKAKEWYKKASDQYSDQAKEALERLLSPGEVLEEFIYCPELVAKAQRGDPIAQYKLAGFYDRGEGVVLDKKQAISWYRKSADQGNEKALGPLFDCFYSILQKSASTEAFQGLRDFSAKGNSRAQYLLGLCYLNGEGVSQSNLEAVKVFLLSAQQGNRDAMITLRDYYRMNTNVDAATYWEEKLNGGTQ